MPPSFQADRSRGFRDPVRGRRTRPLRRHSHPLESLVDTAQTLANGPGATEALLADLGSAAPTGPAAWRLPEPNWRRATTSTRRWVRISTGPSRSTCRSGAVETRLSRGPACYRILRRPPPFWKQKWRPTRGSGPRKNISSCWRRGDLTRFFNGVLHQRSIALSTIQLSWSRVAVAIVSLAAVQKRSKNGPLVCKG
jgi:hypothetical protein